MITESLMQLGAWFSGLIAGLFPAWDVPPQVLHIDQQLRGFVGGAAAMGVWVPWALLGTCIGLVLGTWVVGASIKLLRAVASYIPFVGGAG